MQLGSIVLAGGRSRRMGKPKELLPFLDGTLLGRTVETLLACTHPVVVVARDEQQELPPLPVEAEITHDGEPDQGPLVGMLAGMKALEGECEAAFVTTCDVPFLDARAISWLAEELGSRDLVVPKVQDRLQPLSAIYRLRLLAKIEELIKAGVRTPRTLAAHVDARILDEAAVDAFDPERRFLRGVNSPEEYARARREAEGRD